METNIKQYAQAIKTTPNTQNATKEKSVNCKTFKGCEAETSSQTCLENYNRATLVNKKDTEKLNSDRLSSLGITNFREIENRNVRGESLSSKKNRKFIIPVSKCGIKNVIDLRDKYTSTSYEEICKEHNLSYYHIPIDADSVDTKELIKSLPELFEVLNRGNTYIACAQGLHRTDIALAINYIFNPREQSSPPILYGHYRNGTLKFEDIAKRVNAIKKQITEEEIRALGWNNIEEFERAYRTRRMQLKSYNEMILPKVIQEKQDNKF